MKQLNGQFRCGSRAEGCLHTFTFAECFHALERVKHLHDYPVTLTATPRRMADSRPRRSLAQYMRQRTKAGPYQSFIIAQGPEGYAG